MRFAAHGLYIKYRNFCMKDRYLLHRIIVNSGSVVTDIIHFNPVINDLSDLQLPLLALLITWREKLMRIFTFEVFIF